MANYANILAEIAAAIYSNDAEEITGDVLQQVLLDMVPALSVGYEFKGIASPLTDPGVIDAKVWYIGPSGTYTNFGASAGAPFVVPDGNIAIFRYDTVWHRETMPISAVIEIVNNLTEGGIDKALSAEMGKTLAADIQTVADDLEDFESAEIATTVQPYGYDRIAFTFNDSGQWKTALTGQGSKVIPIPDGIEQIELTPTTGIMMWVLLSAYTNIARNNTSVRTIATGTANRYSATAQTVLTDWSNAKFIVVRADDPSDDSAGFPTIRFISASDFKTATEEAFEETDSRIGTLERQMSPGESLPFGALKAGYIMDNGRWARYTQDNTHLSAHYEIAIVPGTSYKIVATDTMHAEAYWLSASEEAVDGASAPIVSAKITIPAGRASVITAPRSAAYLYVAAAYIYAELTPAAVELLPESSTMGTVIPYYDVTEPQKVELGGLTVQNCSFGSDGNWLSLGKHIAFAVQPGEKYVIRGSGDGFWAWLSSSYSPPVTAATPVPYASGYQRVLQKDAVAVTVPEGAAWLGLVYVNGAGVYPAWSVFRVSSYSRKYNWPVKLRYASWNIGAFMYTDWSVGDPTHAIPAEDADEYALKYRQVIDAVGADVLGISEYNASYSEAAQVTRDVIFPAYLHVYEGTKRGASCNTVMFNGGVIDYVGKEEVVFAVRQENRYYTHVTARVAGENVHFVQAHLDHTYNDKRVAQIAELISKMAGYKYVVIAGDFNTSVRTIDTELAAFKNAGYTIANDGYIGLVVTSLTQEYVDNICVRGFTMSNIQTSEESGTLSDHLLIQCMVDMNFLL